MRRKVTLKVFTQFLHEFEAHIDALHLKRDSFLNHLLDHELPYLESDLRGKRLSVSARRFIACSLKQLGTSQINVQLNVATAERLDKIALSHNLVRDSFINRLLYFSLGSESLLAYFDVNMGGLAIRETSLPTGYLPAMQQLQKDPLTSLRRLVKEKHDIGLYIAPLPVELAGFECYLNQETFWNTYSAQCARPNFTANHLRSFENLIYQERIIC